MEDETEPKDSYSTSAYRMRIEAALLRDGYARPEADEISFHLWDWERDLKEFSAFQEDPSRLTDEELLDFIGGMLVHLQYHINQANRLYFREVGRRNQRKRWEQKKRKGRRVIS